MTKTTTYNTERFEKPFNELTDAGKTRRLNMYEKERAERGTTQALVRMVREPNFKSIKDDATLAILRVAEYVKEKDSTEFYTLTAYIGKDKEGLKSFYEGLTKGQLISVEYKSNNGYNNIWNAFDRSYADNSKVGRKDSVKMPISAQANDTLEP